MSKVCPVFPKHVKECGVQHNIRIQAQLLSIRVQPKTYFLIFLSMKLNSIELLSNTLINQHIYFQEPNFIPHFVSIFVVQLFMHKDHSMLDNFATKHADTIKEEHNTSKSQVNDKHQIIFNRDFRLPHLMRIDNAAIMFHRHNLPIPFFSIR